MLRQERGQPAKRVVDGAGTYRSLSPFWLLSGHFSGLNFTPIWSFSPLLAATAPTKPRKATTKAKRTRRDIILTDDVFEPVAVSYAVCLVGQCARLLTASADDDKSFVGPQCAGCARRGVDQEDGFVVEREVDRAGDLPGEAGGLRSPIASPVWRLLD